MMLPARSGLGVPSSGRSVTQVGIAAHIARLRAVVGHELLLLPSVSVLPVDEAGRVLLVRHAGQDDGWGVLGGAVDVGESPAAAAVREAREEISADVRLVRLVDVLGGPDFEVSYPNGDRAAYVTAVYEALIITGSPAPGDDELSELAWFTPGQLPGLQLSRFSRALLHATGRL
jgi:ADP-ribose pyrophosphatase YjhB (NUDIX family)